MGSIFLQCHRLIHLACAQPRIGSSKTTPVGISETTDLLKTAMWLTETGTNNKYCCLNCLFMRFLWGKFGGTGMKMPFKHSFCGMLKIIPCIVLIRLVMRWCTALEFSLWALQLLDFPTNWVCEAFGGRLETNAWLSANALVQICAQRLDFPAAKAWS